MNHPVSSEAPATDWRCRRIRPPHAQAPGQAAGLRDSPVTRPHPTTFSRPQRSDASGLGRLAWLLRGVPAALSTGQRPGRHTGESATDRLLPENTGTGRDKPADADEQAASRESRSYHNHNREPGTALPEDTDVEHGSGDGDDRPTVRRIYNIADVW